ncbi:MAG TPA: hypothetical protein VL069_02250 [Opitutus sp.]|nr:hypothetical protein [Opitutus sp.]
MLQIANRELRVDLLDPASDQRRLGPRFCGGGYIWQVTDPEVGPLLTGPEWPREEPQNQNGQGLPESFRHSTVSGEPLLWDGPIGLAPGGGALARNADGTVTITEPCLWQIDLQPERATFRTSQNVATWSYALERTIELRGRHLRSHSRLTNRGSAPLVFEWFAHPYFALGADGLLRAILPAGTQLSENPGYLLQGQELTLRRAFVGEFDGHLEQLVLPAGHNFSATLSHPRLSGIRFATDFPPFKCVLWANGNTLSLEPFLALHLAPAESREWNLTYDFGPVAPSH